MNDNIKKLEEINKELSEPVTIDTLESLIQGKIKNINNNCGIEYKANKGTILAFNLFNIPEIAICKVFFSPLSIMDKHIHENEIEYVIVFKGDLEMSIYRQKNSKYPDKVINLSYSDYLFKIDKGIYHSVKSGENDTWAICITIPADKGFPK